MLVVNPELPVHSVKELIALAKEKPGELQYASAGIGSFQHLGGELFKLKAGVDLLHVPFKGGGPAMIDVIGGHTKVMFSSLVQTTPHIKSGKLRALGTGGIDAQSGAARRADHRRGRRAGLRGGQLVGHRRARRHAGRRSSRSCTRSSTRCRNPPRCRSSSPAKAPQIVQMSSAEFGSLHGERNEQVGARGEGGRHQGGVMHSGLTRPAPSCRPKAGIQ